jgi:hypothetical protein
MKDPRAGRRTVSGRRGVILLVGENSAGYQAISRIFEKEGFGGRLHWSEMPMKPWTTSSGRGLTNRRRRRGRRSCSSTCSFPRCPGRSS